MHQCSMMRLSPSIRSSSISSSSRRSCCCSCCWTLCGILSVLLLLVGPSSWASGFFLNTPPPTSRTSHIRSPVAFPLRSDSNNNNNKPRRPRSNQPQPAQQVLTIADLRDQLLQNPARWQQQQQQLAAAQQATQSKTKKKSKTTAATTTASRRTRRRVDQPQQTYLYAAQRKKLPPPQTSNATITTATTTDTTITTMEETIRRQQVRRRELVQELGLQLTLVQHCDPVWDAQPTVVAQIRVQDDPRNDDDDDDPNHSRSSSSSQYAYLIDKPAGWSILGSNSNNSNNSKKRNKTASSSSDQPIVGSSETTKDVEEYSEADILALLTPDERQEYLSSSVPTDTDKDEKDDTTAAAATDPENESTNNYILITSRPSVVAWLKEWKASQGQPIKGGNFWTAVAGASQVDDSGLVLLCPKTQVHNLFVERAEYTAVLGNGGHLAPPLKSKTSAIASTTTAAAALQAIPAHTMARLRKGRGDDVVETVHIILADQPSFCIDAVPVGQTKFGQGIRGDAAGSPLERYAPRRLIHCRTLSVSSLAVLDNPDHAHVSHTTATLPDDIAIWSERRNHGEYTRGSYLGRSNSLRLSSSGTTTAYREINGAADGFPGWIVDRYGAWLLVSHDPQQPRGPLPSIHDGHTAGVYYMEHHKAKSASNRQPSSSGAPRLIEGRPAPELFPVLENGITYLVSFHDVGSTGLFLDQRPQRAWLARHCHHNTRLLNCFAHTGAFSVAAAVAGAATVNLDLSSKWLDRFPQHLQANGIVWKDKDSEGTPRHDCIYGDCFDWLARLAKRGETYDIVILDPPSSSVGIKKKRWSVKNDMSELVTLAARLVRKGGLLWTTTNSKSLSAEKFASLCRQGLDDAGLANAKLERIQPMPVDFPSVGAQPVKNLVWRIPNE